MKKNSAARLGFWSSLIIALLGVLYLLTMIDSFLSEGFTYPPAAMVQLLGGIITFLMVPALLVLFTAIRFVNDEDDKVLGSLGISFITLFAATVSINRFVQLTVIRQSAPGLASQDLTRFLPYAPGSIMFALEMLGWGFFSSMAALCVAPLFSNSRMNLSIRWLFIAYALFSFMSMIGYATETPVSAAGFIAWGPILLVLSILLAVKFSKE